MDDSENQQKRIEKIAKSLKSLLRKGLKTDKLRAADGIIRRVAFMQVELEDLEFDIKQHGTTEMFSQTPGVKYARERPASAIYNRTIKNYVSACKQLFDLLPKEDKSQIPAQGAELLKFVAAGGGK
ncbi:MAG: hypothetical protein ABF449_10015 [Ethanoligenens sp.]